MKKWVLQKGFCIEYKREDLSYISKEWDIQLRQRWNGYTFIVILQQHNEFEESSQVSLVLCPRSRRWQRLSHFSLWKQKRGFSEKWGAVVCLFPRATGFSKVLVQSGFPLSLWAFSLFLGTCSSMCVVVLQPIGLVRGRRVTSCHWLEGVFCIMAKKLLNFLCFFYCLCLEHNLLLTNMISCFSLSDFPVPMSCRSISSLWLNTLWEGPYTPFFAAHQQLKGRCVGFILPFLSVLSASFHLFLKESKNHFGIDLIEKGNWSLLV